MWGDWKTEETTEYGFHSPKKEYQHEQVIEEVKGCSWGCALGFVCVRGGHRLKSGVVFHCLPSSFSETGSLTEPGAHPSTRQPGQPSAGIPVSVSGAGILGMHHSSQPLVLVQVLKLGQPAKTSPQPFSVSASYTGLRKTIYPSSTCSLRKINERSLVELPPLPSPSRLP